MNDDDTRDAGFGWFFVIGTGFLLLLGVVLAVALAAALLGLRMPWS